MKRLQGKVAIVTASTQGIGYSIAERLGLEGASVVVSSRKQTNVDEAVERLRAKGIEVTGLVCHVSNAQQRKDLIDKTIQKFRHIDIIVSNAAANPTTDNILDTKESVLDKSWEINVKASILLIQMAGCCKVEPLLPLPFAREPSLLAKRAYLNLSPRRLSSFTPWCPVVAPRANATNHALFLSSPGDGAGTSPPPPLGLVRPSRQVPTRSPQSNGFREWDAMTARFVGTANMSFLLLKLPQIIPNARNLMASNKGALFVVPWLGMLMGCWAISPYFRTSRRRGRRRQFSILMQTLGMVSTYAVIMQLAMVECMPLPHFTVTSMVMGTGLVLNFLNCFGWLGEGAWRRWEDFITVGGLVVLPQAGCCTPSRQGVICDIDFFNCRIPSTGINGYVWSHKNSSSGANQDGPL